VQHAQGGPDRLPVGAGPGPRREADRLRGRQGAHLDQALGRRAGQRQQADPEPGPGGVQHAAEVGGLVHHGGGDVVLAQDRERPAADGARLQDRDQRPGLVRGRGSPGRGRTPDERQRADTLALLGAGLGDEDHQVHRPPVERVVERRGPVEAELDVQVGADDAERADDGRQDVVGRVIGGADGGVRALGRRQPAQRLVMHGGDPARLGQQRQAVRSQPRPAAVRLHQPPPEHLLQAAAMDGKASLHRSRV
jgi:hypothetical protein